MLSIRPLVPFTLVPFTLALVVTLGAFSSSAAAREPAPETAPGQPAAPQAAPQAEAEDDSPPILAWSFDAQLRPRAEMRTNHHFGRAPDELTRGGIYAPAGDTLVSFSQRSRLGAGLEAADLSAYLQMQHAAEWGLFGGDELSDPLLTLHQGWLKYAPGRAWYVQAGRQELVYGDHRVLGNVGWTQVARAWDALRVGVQPDDAFGVDVFAGRYAAGAAEFGRDLSLFDGDAWLTGAYVQLRDVLEPAVDELDLYALYDVQIDDLSDDAPNRRNRVGLGARAAGQWGIVDGVVEGMYQLGTACAAEDARDCPDLNRDVRAWFVDAEVGVELYRPANARLFAAFSHASGDDPDTPDTDEAYFQFYPTAHKWLGLMDIIGGRSNIQEIRGGFSFDVGPVGLRETVHYFSRVEPDAEAVGLEFDTVASAALTDALDLGVGHGLFVPADGMAADGRPDGVANWAFVQMDATF